MSVSASLRDHVVPDWCSGSRVVWRTRTACLVVMLTFGLAGCATVQPTSEPNLPIGPQVFIEHFRLSGRLSVRIADRLDSARIEWVRDSKGETLRFFSPFGSQLAEVVSNVDGATLTRGSAVEYAKSVGVLTQSVIGVAIDTDLLARWVQGIDIVPTAVLTSGDGVARWLIRAENVRAVDGVVGGRVAMRTSATEAGTSIRLVIDSFSPM